MVFMLIFIYLMIKDIIIELFWGYLVINVFFFKFSIIYFKLKWIYYFDIIIYKFDGRKINMFE